MNVSDNSLYFTLGLDDKQFNQALEAAKKRVAELSGNAKITIGIDEESIRKQLQAAFSGLQNSTKVKVDDSELKRIDSQIAETQKKLEGLNSAKFKNQSEIDRTKGWLDTLVKQREAAVAAMNNAAKQTTATIPPVGIKLNLPASELTRIQGEIKTALTNAKIDIPLNPKVTQQKLKTALAAAMKNIEVQITAKPVVSKKNLKKLELEVNKSTLRNSITSALKNQVFKAKVSLVVEKAQVQDAIRQAFAQAGLRYETTKSDINQAKVEQIRSTTRNQELLNQEKLNQLRNKGIDDANKRAQSLQRTLLASNGWDQQLGNQITDAFSLYTIQRFIQSLYTIGGEFQKQQIALQSMIGDMDKANAVFERIKDLSVKSPFTFSELARYTKQTSAYGIEYEELYDTTKRLADISAGVGVDMGRLILAYGQVRSAEVLRGQELRQFTEAGIPLVQELAKRLSEVRGEAVEVGEVFEAISKREVSFGMVKDVLFDMTDPGGRFFESQERLAQSLAGKWSNLKDAWDIMIASIANGQNTVLSALADAIAWITRNWQLWFPLMSGITVGLGALSLAMGAATLKTKIFTSALMVNPYVAAAAAILGIATAIYGYISSVESATEASERLTAELEKQMQTFEENEANANRYLDILEKQADSEEEKLKLQNQQQIAFNAMLKMYPELLKDLELEKLTLEDIARLRGQINEYTHNESIESTIDTKAKLTSEKNRLQRELATMEKTNKTNKTPIIDSEFFISLGGWFNDAFGTSDEDLTNKRAEIEAVNQSILELEQTLKRLRDDSDRKKEVIKLTDKSPLEDYIKVYKELGEAVYILRKGGITGAIADPVVDKSVIKYVEELNNELKDAENIMKSFVQGSKIYEDMAVKIKILKAAISALNGAVDDGGGGSKDPVAEMWKDRVAAIEKAVKMYDQWKQVEGKDKAESRVKGRDEFADLFSGKYGFKLDLEKPTAAYEYIQSLLDENKEKQKELIVNLGVKVSDAELADAKDELNNLLDALKRELDKKTSEWNLYKDLLKATGNKGLSMNIAFGGDIGFSTELDWLKSEIQKKLSDAFKFDDVIAMSGDQLKESGLANIEPLVEKYNEATKKLSQESIKNFIDILNASKDFAHKVSDLEEDLQRTLNTIYSQPLPYDEKKRLEAQAYKNFDEGMSKLNFEEFKKTSNWVKIFDDLDRVSASTLDEMIAKIEDFSEGGIESEQVLKDIIAALRKLREESLERNPFKGISDAAARLGDINAKISKATTDEEKEELKKERKSAYADMDKAMSHISTKFSNLSKAVGDVSSLLERFGNTSLTNFANFLDSMSSGMQSGMNIGSLFGGAGSVIGGFFGTAVGAMASLYEAGQKAVEAEQERSQVVIDRLEKINSILKDKISESLMGLYGATLDATSRMEMEDLKNKYDYSEEYFKKRGQIDPNSYYVALLDTAKTPWDTNDYLVYAKKTHDAINKALEMDNAYLATYANLLAQRDELYYQQANYTDKDEDKVKQYRRDKGVEIEKLNQEIRQVTTEMMSSLYSVDFKDWAGQFADSIVNAWANGESAAEAYGKTVGDVMRNVATSIVQQAIIGKYLQENLQDIIEMFEGKGGIMDNEMFDALLDLVDGLQVEQDKVETLLDGFEKAANKRGFSLKETDSTSKDELSKGIQSVTESTADLLASYLNSLRGDVSVKRTLLEKLIADDIPQMSIIAQAQLTQLNNIAANTLRSADAADRIFDLVNRVVDKGNNKLKI